MNSTVLKLIAIITMIIDHVGLRLTANNLILRGIGRLAFPIFAFQLVEGYKHTKNLNKYKLRLLVFALVSEIPYNLLLSNRISYDKAQNIGFTLLLGLFAIELLEKSLKYFKMLPESKNLPKDTILAFTNLFLTASLVYLAEVLKLDYKYRGMLTILILYVTTSMKKLNRVSKMSIAAILLAITYSSVTSMPIHIIPNSDFTIPLQMLATFSIIFIGLYNGRKGRTLVEFIEDSIEVKAGIRDKKSSSITKVKCSARDEKGNRIEVEVIEPASAKAKSKDNTDNLRDFETNIKEIATREVARYAIDKWRQTKVREILNTICKYSTYIIYPLHIFIIYVIANNIK